MVVRHTGFRRQPHITEGLGFGLTFGTTFKAAVRDVALGTGRAECVWPCSLSVLQQEDLLKNFVGIHEEMRDYVGELGVNKRIILK